MLNTEYSKAQLFAANIFICIYILFMIFSAQPTNNKTPSIISHHLIQKISLKFVANVTQPNVEFEIWKLLWTGPFIGMTEVVNVIFTPFTIIRFKVLDKTKQRNEKVLLIYSVLFAHQISPKLVNVYGKN